MKKGVITPFIPPKNEEEKIYLMISHHRISYDDIVVIAGNYLLCYKRNFENLNLVEFDFKNGYFTNQFNIGDLNKQKQDYFRQTFDDFQLLSKEEKINTILNLEKDYTFNSFGWLPMRRG